MASVPQQGIDAGSTLSGLAGRRSQPALPGFTFNGDVVDHGGGKIEQRGALPLKSETRRISAGSHDITESKEIDQIWSGIKHGILFTVSYTGLSE